MPATLRGTLFRNGSGRNQLGGQWFPHWFDGDGMIAALRFDDDGIHFRNRYVATDNYRDETGAGRIIHRGFGKMRPGGVLANAFRLPANVSNTSVRDGRRPAAVAVGRRPALSSWIPATLETRGLEKFGGKMKAFSAHPKRDPDTGELFNFGVDYGARCTLTPYRLAKGDAHGAAEGHPALRGDEPRLRADEEPPGVLHRADPPSPLAFLLGFKSFDGGPALGGQASRP